VIVYDLSEKDKEIFDDDINIETYLENALYDTKPITHVNENKEINQWRINHH